MPHAPPSEQAVMEALKQVRYPGFSRDIVSFGIVKGVRVHGEIVSARLELITDRPEVLDQIKQQAEVVLRALPGVERVLVETKVLPPPSAVPRAAQGFPAGGLLPGVRHTVAVASGKGGVGKSTVAVNLAVALAQSGWRTGLLDADIYGPSIPLMMGTVGETLTHDARGVAPLERYGVGMMSIGFFLERDAALVWRGPMVMKAVTQMLQDVDWGERDYLVVDLPPGTGDAQLTLSQSIRMSGAVIVATPQEVALVDAVKGVMMFRKVEVPILGIVENMSYFLCPGCGTRADIFSHGGAAREAARLGVPFLGEIPIHPDIRAGGDAGVPMAAGSPDSPQAAAFRSLAAAVVEQLDGAGARPAASGRSEDPRGANR